MTTPLLVFAAIYFLIAVQRVRWLRLNRPAAALLGAVGMVTIGGVARRAVEHGDRRERGNAGAVEPRWECPRGTPLA